MEAVIGTILANAIVVMLGIAVVVVIAEWWKGR